MTTIPVGSGLAAQLVVKDESTYGVAPDLTSGTDSFEFNSETLELKKTPVVGTGLAAGHVYERKRRRVITQYDVSGDIVMDLPTRGMAFWLRYMLGSFGQSLATPTEIGTTGIYKSVHQPGTQYGHSFCAQKGAPATDATVIPVTYVGNKLTGWSVACSTGAIATLTLNVDGRNELAGTVGGAPLNGDPLNATVPALAAWAVPTSGLGYSSFHFKEATLYSASAATEAGGIVSLTSPTPLGNVKDATFGQTFAFDTTRIFIGSKGFKGEPIENGYRAITGSFTIEFQSSLAMYTAFAEDSDLALQLTFVGDTVSTSNYLFDLIIPAVRLEGESVKVPGPQVLTQQVNFTGYDDEATTPFQITYQSEDSTI